jgi:hypothetical protein
LHRRRRCNKNGLKINHQATTAATEAAAAEAVAAVEEDSDNHTRLLPKASIVLPQHLLLPKTAITTTDLTVPQLRLGLLSLCHPSDENNR